MNTFVLQEYQRLERVTFYSIREDDSDRVLVDKFIERYLKDSDYRENLLEIVNLMKKIGTEIGAAPYFFRPEREAKALPPSQYYHEEQSIQYFDNNLRLFCYVVSECIVVLFDGGIKDAQTAQDSSLSIQFYQAQRFSKAIREYLRDGDWEIDDLSHSIIPSNGKDDELLLMI